MADMLAGTLQDGNAGNLGDLLKHFWLLLLIDRAIQFRRPSGISYIESHSGSGKYKLDKERVAKLERQKAQVCSDPDAWKKFEQYNPNVAKGWYQGSFAQALQRLADWQRERPQRLLNSVLWECDQNATTRIKQHRSEVIPPSIGGIELREETCTPQLMVREIEELRAEGHTVIWLCDPFWGNTKNADTVWWELLEKLPSTYGIIFAYVGGDSRKRGPEKFRFSTIGAPGEPDKRADENVRSYGLYFTQSARSILSAS